MITTIQSAAVADPASSHRDDPGPSTTDRSAAESASADAEPPEPAGKSNPTPDEHESPSHSSPDISIDIADDVAHEIDLLWLDGRLRDAANHLPHPIARVSIRIVGDLEMTALNRRFHDTDDTTDVLTFHDPDAGDSVDADLALCADEASRQAESRNNPIERELLLYALHGLLHCCGFDDTNEDSFAAIHAEEDRILSAIGVGATFTDGVDDARMREQRP